jgi:aromatic ring-opening dioxygenase catalytic subunit (LigB family)
VISGHWEEDAFTVTGHPHPPLLFDYYGFPEHSSGMSYHNLRGFISGAQGTCDPFDQWLTDAVRSAPERREQLLSEWSNAPCARLAHPREEHLLPLVVAAGAADHDAGAEVFNDRIMGELISAYQFGK